MADGEEYTGFRWNSAHASGLCAGLVTCLAIVAVSVEKELIPHVRDWHIALAYILAITVPVVAYWRKAKLEGRLPTRRLNEKTDGMPVYRHISGTAAFWVLGFLAVIVTISAWATLLETAPRISGWFGLIVIGLLLVLFFWFARYSYTPGRYKQSGEMNKPGVLRILGRAFSILDSWLVFPIANSAGMALNTPWRRYALLLSFLGPIPILSWYLPTPLAFVPLAWAFVVILGIARQWSWVEEDREIAMLNRSFETKDLRIGFRQDPRDEALISFAAMLLIIPVALRAIFLSLEPFVQYEPSSNESINLGQHSYWNWMSLFGTELAKAVPFVDWAEIFRVEGEPFIEMNAENSVYQWVIFGMRVVVDLILLGALVQAISIVSRISKQKQMFFVDGTLPRLDPFIEDAEFKHLARGRPGDWYLRNEKEFEAFPPYDEDALEYLAVATIDGETENDPLGTEHSAKRFIARKLRERDEARPPEYLLHLQVRRKEPNEEIIEELIAKITSKMESADADQIQISLNYLNREKKLIDTRKELTRIAGMNTGNPKFVQLLSQILIGTRLLKQDSRREVRRIALEALQLPASLGNLPAQSAIAEAARKDPSDELKAVARGILTANEHWFELEAHARQMIENPK
ncbi:MAG: hypothetical protein AAF583_04525 [Pseudomonadota bacterium]